MASLEGDPEAVGLESDALDPQELPQVTPPGEAIGSDGRVEVDKLIAAAAQDDALQRFRPLVVVTGHDLARSGCESLWGYADSQKQIAVVSTARIRHADPARTRARLDNLIRHELGHLEGWSHCRHPGCLMCPARNPDALDSRSAGPCAHAKPRRRWSSPLWHRVAAVTFLLMLFGATNLVAVLLKRAPRAPFALSNAASPEDAPAGRLMFNGQRMRHSSAVVASDEIADELNRLFRMIDPPELRVVARGGQEAIVMAQDAELLRVRHEQAAAEAEQLTRQLNGLIAAKGSRHSLCAECHLERKPEVLEAANGRKWTLQSFCP